MRILFLSTNRFRFEMAQPMPIGLACIIAGIEENAHAIEVLDLMFSEDPPAELASALERFQPEMVAISIRNTDNFSYLIPQYFLPEAKQMIDLCRKASPAKIVVGGAAFTTVPEALFGYLEPDFGIAGEGEVSFPQLVACIENGTDWSNVPGLVWRAQGEIRANAPTFIEDWAGLRRPRRDLFDLAKYTEMGGADPPRLPRRRDRRADAALRLRCRLAVVRLVFRAHAREPAEGHHKRAAGIRDRTVGEARDPLPAHDPLRWSR